MDKIAQIFEANSKVCYSATTISKRLQLKRTFVRNVLRNNELYTNVDPLRVGSKKKTVDVYTLK